MDAILVSQCIILLSGAFALVSLGLLFIRTSTLLQEATKLLTMLEVTIEKANHILDDVNTKLDMLNAPVELVTGFFSKGRMKLGAVSAISALGTLFKKKKNKK